MSDKPDLKESVTKYELLKNPQNKYALSTDTDKLHGLLVDPKKVKEGTNLDIDTDILRGNTTSMSMTHDNKKNNDNNGNDDNKNNDNDKIDKEEYEKNILDNSDSIDDKKNDSINSIKNSTSDSDINISPIKMHKKSTPKYSTSNHSTPKKSTPKHSTPKHSTPKKSTPKHSTPKQIKEEHNEIKSESPTKIIGGINVISMEEYNKLPERDQRLKKIELYNKLAELKQRGIPLTKDYTIHSSYEDMSIEYELQYNIKCKDQGVGLAKKMLVTFVSAGEYLNASYDPFKFDLDGFTEELTIDLKNNTSGYDQVLGEIYDKYKGSGSTPPEIKLMLMLGASATTFHLNKQAQKVPLLGDVLKNNPEMVRNIRQNINSNISGPTEEDKQKKINIERQRMYENMKRTQEMQRNNQHSFMSQMNTNNGQTPRQEMSRRMQMQANERMKQNIVNRQMIQPNDTQKKLRILQEQRNNQQQPIMQRPSRTQDIMNKIKNKQELIDSDKSSDEKLRVTSTMTETEVVDSVTGNKKKVRRKKKKNPVVFIDA